MQWTPRQLANQTTLGILLTSQHNNKNIIQVYRLNVSILRNGGVLFSLHFPNLIIPCLIFQLASNLVRERCYILSPLRFTPHTEFKNLSLQNALKNYQEIKHSLQYSKNGDFHLHVGDVFVNACKMESASRVDIIFNISSACCSSPTSRRASRATTSNSKKKSYWIIITHVLLPTIKMLISKCKIGWRVYPHVRTIC